MISLKKSSLLMIVIGTVLILLASCASEATKLNIEPQAIELQTDSNKAYTKGNDGKQHHKGNPFELVATISKT